MISWKQPLDVAIGWNCGAILSALMLPVASYTLVDVCVTMALVLWGWKLHHKQHGGNNVG